MISRSSYLFVIARICVGSGVKQLRDDRMDTYWQSNGKLPHLVNVEFRRKTTVSDIYIYTDHKLDDTYTPSRISIRAGTHYNDLQEIEVVVLEKPSGTYVLVGVSFDGYKKYSRLGANFHERHQRQTEGSVHDTNRHHQEPRKR